MAAVDSDRNLLFGLIALQNGLIDQGQLVAAFQAWTLEKARDLADILVAQGHLDAGQRAVVDAMLGLHLMKHGSTDKSLAAVSVRRSMRASLAQLGDRDIEATLARVSSDSTSADDDADRTASYSGGSATSDGQRYRVLRPHARGGLGAIFVALDIELNREVALKQILDHHAADHVSRQRFLLEAEITGGLEHPGIVPVYGLGVYCDGRPYYAMRFVRGDTLKDTIAHYHANPALEHDPGARSLELRKLLRRFTDVCNAIDYAHGRGIIHRDIKPSNVIVGRYGETLVVDWGLAKPLGRAERGPASEEPTLIPSSASGSSETLPGSALGTPGYMSPEQANGNLDQLGPRSDVYSLGATLYCLITGEAPFVGEAVDVIPRVQRGNFRPPRELAPSIDRALEAVCLKAMSPRPEDRYASSRALAEDVERWMADEPVSTWREPASRRTRRWARRHRSAVTAAAACVLMSLVGTAAVLAVQARANRDLKAANLDLAMANTRFATANTELQAANRREAARFTLAMDAIRTFHTGVSEDLLLKERQFNDLRTRLLRAAADFYRRLEGLLKGQTDRNSRAALAKAYDELGQLTDKIGSKPLALAIHRDALAVRRTLVPDNQAEHDVARNLLAVALLCVQTGDTAGAVTAFEEAIGLAEKLVASGKGASELKSTLARCYAELGSLLRDTGKPTDGMTFLQRSLEINRALAETNPGEPSFQYELARSYSGIGVGLTDTGQPLESLAMLERSLSIYHRLTDTHPGVIQYQAKLADTYYNRARAFSRMGKRNESIESYQEARAIYQGLSDQNPNITLFLNYLSDTYNNIGNEYYRTNRNDKAKVEWEQALAVRKRLAETNPRVVQFQSNLASSYDNLAEFMTESGAATDAIAYSERALAIRQQVAAANPTVVRFRQDLRNSFQNVGFLKARTGKPIEGLAAHESALSIQRELALAHPDDIQMQARPRVRPRRVRQASAGNWGDSPRRLRPTGRLWRPQGDFPPCPRSITTTWPVTAPHWQV